MKDLVALIIMEALSPVLALGTVGWGGVGQGGHRCSLNLLDSSGKAKEPSGRPKQEVQVALTPAGESLGVRMCPVTLRYREGREDRHFKGKRSLLERWAKVGITA